MSEKNDQSVLPSLFPFVDQHHWLTSVSNASPDASAKIYAVREITYR